jgi:3-isopropylmalate/(R)-2-methylmalate dehydratase large subunit
MAAWWTSMASDADAVYDDDVEIRAGELTPIVTWGVNPGQSIGVHDGFPLAADANDPKAIADALSYMGLPPVSRSKG